MRLISQGTISILFGCHNIVHSLLVIISWRKLYGSYPKFWQLCCILLHDIGHIGLNYLNSLEKKEKHWILGAKIAKVLFGWKGYYLVSGHCEYSLHSRSLLYKADKYSWYIAPYWWLYSNTIFEPKLRMGYRIHETIVYFKKQVRNSIETGEFKSTHQLFLERCIEVKDRGLKC